MVILSVLFFQAWPFLSIINHKKAHVTSILLVLRSLKSTIDPVPPPFPPPKLQGVCPDTQSFEAWPSEGLSLWASAAGKSPSAELDLLDLTHQSLALMDNPDRQDGSLGTCACTHTN